jgi:hypothetical protein
MQKTIVSFAENARTLEITATYQLSIEIGMVVAQSLPDDFCTNKSFGSEWLTKGGKPNVVDDLCNSTCLVAAWCS